MFGTAVAEHLAYILEAEVVMEILMEDRLANAVQMVKMVQTYLVAVVEEEDIMVDHLVEEKVEMQQSVDKVIIGLMQEAAEVQVQVAAEAVQLVDLHIMNKNFLVEDEAVPAECLLVCK